MAPGSDVGKDSAEHEDEGERLENKAEVTTEPDPRASRGDAHEEDRGQDRDSERRGGGEGRGSTLYVSNIAAGSVERDLEKIFAEIGRVRKCTVIYDPRSGQSRGFAFVEMVGADEAEQCVYELNKKVKLDGNTLLVEKARRTAPRNPTPGSYMGVRSSRRETGMRDHPYGRGSPPTRVPMAPAYDAYRRPAYDSYGHPPPPQQGPPPPYGYEPYAPRYGGPPPEYDRDARGRSPPPRERDRERITLPAHYRAYTGYQSVYPPSGPSADRYAPPADRYAPAYDADGVDRRPRDAREYADWDRRR